MSDIYETIVQQILKQEDSTSQSPNNNHDDPDYKQFLEEEKIREQNPSYLAEKERILMNKLIEEDSPFYHPCQNPENTVTLLSGDKCHEIDIEIDKTNLTALLNIIKIDSSERESFISLLYSITTFLNTESIKKVYQHVMPSDWDMRLKDINEIRLTRRVKSSIEFVIVEMDTSDIVKAISTAMGMDIDSHLDKK